MTASDSPAPSPAWGRFPLYRALRPTLAVNHLAHGLRESDPILPCLEHFLSLKDLPGYDDRLKDLACKAVDCPDSNDGYIQWASICAELGALHLLGRELGLEIIGFDQPSPRRRKQGTDCDFVARLADRPELFAEVRRRAKQDTFTLPAALKKRLQILNQELLYSFTPELQRRPFRVSADELNLIELALRQHLEAFDASKVGASWRASRRPPPLSVHDVHFTFHDKSKLKKGAGHYGAPDRPQDIEAWLFGHGIPGKDGKPKVPMVQAALGKGADWLACRVPDIDPLDTLVEECFRDRQRVSTFTFESADPRLADLAGVVLFARHDVFRIVQNSRSDPQRLLPA